jgi:hypothetical protein
MKRIDTATKAVDLFGAGKHGFKAGNVLAGEAPTKLSAEWFNHAQEELANLVEQFFGVALDDEAVNQLAALFADKFALYATLESPAFTGTPTAPTQATGNNTTRLATTAFVSTAIANLIASSPAALDTLNELATALGNDPNFATTITNALALKAPLASPALTGNPTAPTQAPGNNTTRIATTAFVTAALATISNATTSAAGLVELATNAEAKALSAADRALVPSNLAALTFRSGEINLATGLTGDVAHGLGSLPFSVGAFLICKTAQHGWSVGDMLKIEYTVDSTTTYGVKVAKNETHLKYQVAASSIFVPVYSTGGLGSITLANWKLVLEASLL